MHYGKSKFKVRIDELWREAEHARSGLIIYICFLFGSGRRHGTLKAGLDLDMDWLSIHSLLQIQDIQLLRDRFPPKPYSNPLIIII